MTANYANYNWFGRPYWTEPCAIVDSYMASMALFRLTQQSEYAVLANRIYYNALLASQRPNGGFGCDLCSGTEQSGRFVQANTDVYEAWWCCSMRGAEGLCSAAANSILMEDGQIWFVHYLPGHFHTEQADIDVKTNYPHENRVQLSCAVYGENCSCICTSRRGQKTCPFRSTGSHSACSCLTSCVFLYAKMQNWNCPSRCRQEAYRQADSSRQSAHK